VFSLALTLYEAWTGDNPRRRATPGATARALDQEVPLLADARPDLPARLTETLDACLDLEPGLRPGVEDLGTALEDSLHLLEDVQRAPVPADRRAGILSPGFASGIDPGRIAGAAVTAGMAATGMIVTGAADPASVFVAFVAAAVLTLLNPRIGFLASGAGLAAWLIAVADMPGAAVPVLLLTVFPALLVRGSGRSLAAIPVGPVLGTVGLAPVVPGLAALAEDWRDRALVAAAGLTVTALAEAATGRGLLFDRFAEVPGGWESSVSASITELIVPVMTSATYLVALAVWVGGAVLIGAIIARLRLAGDRRQGEAVTLAAVGSDRL
jgi:hypothetical protein